MSKRRREQRRRIAARDAIADALIERLKGKVSGDYDLGVQLVHGGPGIRVRARIDHMAVEDVLWPDGLAADLDRLACRLAEARRAVRP